MCFTCYDGTDLEKAVCLTLSYGFIPILAITSLTLNIFTFVNLILIKLPSSLQRLFECFVIAQIMSAISVMAALLTGFPGWILHIAFFSLSAYLLFTMLIGGWCSLSMPLEFPKIRSSFVQYVWFGIAALWIIVPALSFVPESVYDPKTGTWALVRDAEFVITFFWYLHRVFPEVLVAFFVIWIKVEAKAMIDDKRITTTMQILGCIFLVANIPSIVNCLILGYDRDDSFHSVQMFMEVMSLNATFAILYFLNPDFSASVMSLLKNLPLMRPKIRIPKPVPHTPTPFVRKRNTVRIENLELEEMIPESQLEECYRNVLQKQDLTDKSSNSKEEG